MDRVTERDNRLAGCCGRARVRPTALLMIAVLGGCCLTAGVEGFARAQEAGEALTQLREEVQAVRQENRDLQERLRSLEAEMASLQQRDGAGIPRLPQEVELCGERVPLERWEVRERLEREFYLMLGNEGQVILWMKRAGRYFPYIEEQLRKSGLPDDLKYVAVAESALLPTAYSRAGAAGFWQFIRSTGQRYSLRLNSYVDERRDLVKATGAALRYLSNLYEEFQSWPLSLAAYNSGENRVSGAIKAQDTKSYYELTLPLETERYVFRIIAAKLILSEPERYGFPFEEKDLYLPLACDEVEVNVKGGSLSLHAIAEATGSYSRELRKLNPALRVDYLPSGKHLLRVPAGTSAALLAMLKNGGKGDGPGRKVVHRVRKGESLWSIAGRYGVRLASLREWNGLQRSSIIHPGDKLTVYTPLR